MAEARSRNQKLSIDYNEEDGENSRLVHDSYSKNMEEKASGAKKTSKPRVEFDASMDVCIFLRDRTGIHAQLEEGHNAEAEDLFDLVLQELGLPEECEDVFALWLTSPILELRLKKKHKPFYMVQQWDDLCSKYSDAKAEDIHDDEPVLMVQRNVFFPKEQEANITCEQVLGYLYHEAKFNIIEGRYIVDPEEYNKLAGIQALITMGKYNQKDHIIETYRANLQQFYPEHIYRKPSSMFPMLKRNREPKEAVEDKMLNYHRQISQEFENEDIDRVRTELYRRYLEILWPYPFYGAALFDSFINKPQGKLAFLKKSHNIETWTAINTNGVCVIDREKDEVLLAVPFAELCWEYGEPQFDIDDDAFPCLYLQFLVTEALADGSQRKVTKILQVFTRQAKMMIALIESCVERKKINRQGIPALDEADGPFGATDFKARCSNKLAKLSLTTFTTSDVQTENQCEDVRPV